MKNFIHFLKRLIENLFYLILIVGLSYGFFALCNWEFNPMDWNGFSRFLLAFVILIMGIATWSALSTTIKNFK